MKIPHQPTRYKKLPHFEGLPNFDVLARLLKGRHHIEAIQTGVTKSNEHTFPIIPYVGRDRLGSILSFRKTDDFDPKAFAPSAFDEGTIQDLKFHMEAHEIYFLLEGKLKILWKKKESATFTHDLTVTKAFPYALIPHGHCLLVASEVGGPFLAVAFKTKESTIGNGGKVLGDKCPHYRNVQCDIRASCECLRANRSSFFEAVRASRVTAVTKAQAIAQQLSHKAASSPKIRQRKGRGD
jgi:hypothetical protein